MSSQVNNDRLKALVEHRDVILLAEIGALIHDLGKLSEEFVRSKCVEESGNWIHHTAILEYDARKNVSHARKVKQILGRIEIKLDKQTIRLYDFVLGHHEKLWDKNDASWDKPENFKYNYLKHNYSKDNIFLKFIASSDTFDSEEDKSHSKDPQSICGVYKSTSFGFENEPIEMDVLTEERKKVYKTIIHWLDTCDFDEIVRKRRKCMNEIRKSFSKALGETRRSANDVTLWDHSYMAASIMKALVACRILDSNFTVGSNQEIKSEKPFQIFAVGWDFFGFIEQSHKIPDVVGRMKVIEKIKEEIKSIVEEEHALGNAIYDDNFGIYFLIPSILDGVDLEEVKRKIFKVFNDKTRGVLLPVLHLEKPKQDEEFRIGKLLTEAMKNMKEKIDSHEIRSIEAPAWIKGWKNSGNVKLSKDRLVCNVCGKGFYCIGDDEKICETCKSIRNKGRKVEAPQTVFVDEIAWNPDRKRYENVCLLIAKFDLDEWLGGKWIESLSMKDIQKLEWLNKFYNSPLSSNEELNYKLLNKILRLGALVQYISGNIRAKNSAKKEIDKGINEFDSLDDEFVKKELEGIRDGLEKARRIVNQEKDDAGIIKDLQDIFNKYLNQNTIISKLEEKIRYGKELSSDERQIIKDSCNISDIVSKMNIQKPSSPSRLMRIWNNTKDFLEDISKQICLKAPVISESKIILNNKIKLKPNVAYIIELEGKEVGEVISLEEEIDELFVITPHTNDFLSKNKDSIKGKKLLLKHPDSKKIMAKTEIRDIKENIRKVIAYRVISISPTLFMAIIPTATSLEVIKTIKEEYAKYFGKVIGKLPLHVGLIYFKRKMPIFAVLDTANRMLEEFEKSGSNNLVRLRVVSEPKEDNNCVTLTLSLENPELTNEKSRPIKYEIKVPYKLGDGSTDYYHSYLRIGDSSDKGIEIKIGDKTITQKHITEIKWNDILVFERYHFDFEFLDSNIRRFDVGKDRKHWLFTDSTNKPKPYLFWDIDSFERLRELIIEELKLTTTQVMNLYEMLMNKIEEWDLKGVDKLKKDEAFEKFVDNAIKSIPLRLKVVDGKKSSKGKITKEDYEFLKNSILTGMFFDFVDLWHTILKRELKKEGGGEHV